MQNANANGDVILPQHWKMFPNVSKCFKFRSVHGIELL